MSIRRQGVIEGGREIEGSGAMVRFLATDDNLPFIFPETSVQKEKEAWFVPIERYKVKDQQEKRLEIVVQAVRAVVEEEVILKSFEQDRDRVHKRIIVSPFGEKLPRTSNERF
jgi:hypothetical protein